MSHRTLPPKHQGPVGVLVHQCPLCPHCDEEVDHTGDCFHCPRCELIWPNPTRPGEVVERIAFTCDRCGVDAPWTIGLPDGVQGCWPCFEREASQIAATTAHDWSRRSWARWIAAQAGDQ